MEFNDYFGKSKENLKDNISSIMNNAFSESSAMTGGRPSSYTFTFAYSKGLEALKSGVIKIIDDSFNSFPITDKNIEVVRKESFIVIKDCFKFIFEKYTATYKNTYGIGKVQYQNSFNKIEFEINKAIDNQKLMLAKNKKKIFWKVIIIIISVVIPAIISVIFPEEIKQTLWNSVSKLLNH